jgi:cytochrome c2
VACGSANSNRPDGSQARGNLVSTPTAKQMANNSESNAAAKRATGDLVSGEKIFHGETPIAGGKVPACTMCHAVEAGGEATIGTNLSNIGYRAAAIAPGQSAEEYLRTSILDPDAYLAGGFQEGIMYREYRQALTPQQIEDLIAYMLTLKNGQDS